MRVIEPGHIYEVDAFDGGEPQTITFMKRVGEGYPGNEAPPHGGTNCQELIRVLINRVKYLEGQISHPENVFILSGLRLALHAFEARAAERHGWLLAKPVSTIENEPTCRQCGHVRCKHPRSA